MVTRRQFLSMAGGVAVLGAAGAAGFLLLPADEEETGLPQIKFGKQPCARCGMIIADARFAAAWRDPAGKARVFDDPGCMLLDQIELAPGEGTQYWVSDYVGESFIDAASAVFVFSTAIKSPMAYGVAAFATTDGAEAAARKLGGDSTDWTGAINEMEGRDL
jgi:copper chaperone NosL